MNGERITTMASISINGLTEPASRFVKTAVENGRTLADEAAAGARRLVNNAAPASDDFVRAAESGVSHQATQEVGHAPLGKKSLTEKIGDRWNRFTNWVGNHKLESALAAGAVLGGAMLLKGRKPNYEVILA